MKKNVLAWKTKTKRARGYRVNVIQLNIELCFEFIFAVKKKKIIKNRRGINPPNNLPTTTTTTTTSEYTLRNSAG